MKQLFTLTALILLTSVLLAQQTGYFTTNFQWTNAAGAQTRSLRVQVPSSYNAAESYSLVIGFHGLGGTPTGYCQSISYYATNPYFGKVIVACPSEGTASTSWFSGSEDFKIISAIINKLKADFNLDTTRVFATGFSFGGKSAYLHGLDEADHIKGIIAHSPGFYNTADINNTCTDPVHCQHKYAYYNAWKVMACITAGSGEYNLGLTEPYLTLASKAAVKLNNSDGDAIFVEDPTGYHNLPPLGIVQQCWTHVSKPSTGLSEGETVMAVHLYPNPASGSINITAGLPGEWKTVTLFSMTGQIVAEVSSTDEHITVDLSPLPEGIYLIRTLHRNGAMLFSGKVAVVR
jgi:hypothetical protein